MPGATLLSPYRDAAHISGLEIELPATGVLYVIVQVELSFPTRSM